jgi:hypothetical protein
VEIRASHRDRDEALALEQHADASELPWLDEDVDVSFGLLERCRRAQEAPPYALTVQSLEDP